MLFAVVIAPVPFQRTFVCLHFLVMKCAMAAITGHYRETEIFSSHFAWFRLNSFCATWFSGMDWEKNGPCTYDQPSKTHLQIFHPSIKTNRKSCVVPSTSSRTRSPLPAWKQALRFKTGTPTSSINQLHKIHTNYSALLFVAIWLMKRVWQVRKHSHTHHTAFETISLKTHIL